MSELTRIGQLAEGKALTPLTPEERVFKKLASNESAGGGAVYEIEKNMSSGEITIVDQFTFNDIFASIEQGKPMWIKLIYKASNGVETPNYIPMPTISDMGGRYLIAVPDAITGQSIMLACPAADEPFELSQ